MLFLEGYPFLAAVDLDLFSFFFLFGKEEKSVASASVRSDDALYFMVPLARILTLSRRLFPGPAREGCQQRSADGFEPGLPAVTGLREQDAHSAPLQ